jgi:hypothetical protein
LRAPEIRFVTSLSCMRAFYVVFAPRTRDWMDVG